MLSKNKIKWVRSLEQKKYRDSENAFVVEGNKMVCELLTSKFTARTLFATSQWFESNSNLKSHFPKETEIVTQNEISQISFQKSPQEVLAIANIPKYEISLGNLDQDIVLALDTIQDPGNLGTIIRLADWFGINTIICSNDTADVYNPKVVQSTMGGIFRVKIHYVQLENVLNDIRNINIPLYGTTLDGDNIYKTELSPNGIIILGNESKGIRDSIINKLNKKLFIPNYPAGIKSSESLNVGTAAAIICAEFRRRLI